LTNVSRSSYPTPGSFFLETATALVLAVFLVVKAFGTRRELREAASPLFLDYYYRRDLASRIRFAEHFAPVWAALLCWDAFVIVRDARMAGPVLAAWLLVYLGGAALCLRERLVVLPRLRREEAGMPDFAEIPRIG
jgi:hypothetical protein